jgi:hypothetical protein
MPISLIASAESCAGLGHATRTATAMQAVSMMPTTSRSAGREARLPITSCYPICYPTGLRMLAHGRDNIKSAFLLLVSAEGLEPSTP